MGSPNENDCIDPLDFILKEHVSHQKLCDLLEEIADVLPAGVDQKKALRAVNLLKYELPLHHQIEEQALFPLLVKYAAREDNADEIVTRLNEEHVVDESFAEELIEFLEQLAQGKQLEDANMFGYMLRGFFESYRRHIMWENNVVLPLARRRLSADGLAELASLITELQTRSANQIDLVRGASGDDTGISLCDGSCEDCRKKPD
jgi:hemerythrin-like domain-containing protein